MRQPMQPIYVDDQGTVRFKENAIVKHLLDCAREGRRCDLNDIAVIEFSQQDREQFAQLIGYSLSGFHELSYVSDKTALGASTTAGILYGATEVGCRVKGCSIHSGVKEE